MRVRDELDAVTTIEGDDGSLGEINDIVGFHIRLAHGACYRHFTETFADLELTQKQVSVMWLVGDHPGISQIDLGQRLRMDRATTMTIINRLQARDYLRREKSPTDGRKQALFLTDAGEAALVQAKRAVQEHEKWVKSRFTDAEVKTLMELLARIHE
ncbi:MarR family transcriptional regulator [Novosphingobium sp.]|jgi:DNA-binding MarR family transcriptional regulator|uniref:MarR family winged helix-turn-helix transcriptional regulator n=1 Tax=Novosphingobium sp. TaxID=1874826 RepID=UPI001EC61D56|nr:MarR family transcriptional regulator [Novosphingobium sp.]MBK6801936.1 MarR family transcriptional regulator [Novosphingobium sp.]MBK9010222.1 MarR family transcriptional regulator [Novosphingobium sp.]